MQVSVNLTPAPPLIPADAVAAFLWTEDCRYMLQRRDPVSTIFRPDLWGFFGCAMDAGEQPLDTLCRELVEELPLDVSKLQPTVTGKFRFIVEFVGVSNFDRFAFKFISTPA